MPQNSGKNGGHIEAAGIKLRQLFLFNLSAVMKLARRPFLQLAAGAAALPITLRHASALDYPTRPVHLIAPFPPGGTGDVVARAMGQCLSDQFHQPFVVDNRPGAATNVGTEIVVRAVPDGYTLLFAIAINASNVALYDKLNFNFERDIAPVASIDSFPFVIEIHASFPAKTIPEFITYAKANPGKIDFASNGVGSTAHLAGELFKMMAGIDMVHVPYRGDTPALIDLLAGRVQVYFGPQPGSIEFIRSGKLRALAVTGTTRSAALPDVPTAADFLQGYEVIGWQGIGAPKNTPADVIDSLNHRVNTALATPKFKGRLAELGYTALTGSPADFGKLIAADTEKWENVVKFAKIKPE